MEQGIFQVCTRLGLDPGAPQGQNAGGCQALGPRDGAAGNHGRGAEEDGGAVPSAAFPDDSLVTVPDCFWSFLRGPGVYLGQEPYVSARSHPSSF